MVDDEAGMRRTLQRYLARAGHRVDVAESVPEALELLARGSYDLVLTDLSMPGPSGLHLIAEVRARYRSTRAILMSAYADAEAAIAAIDRGVDQLLLKPFSMDELRVRVEQALARQKAEQEAERSREILEAQLRRRDMESQEWILRSAHALAAAVEVRDRYLGGHAVRVTAYALVLAETIGGIDLSLFELAGHLHDVGKIGVPDPVLNKPGPLTEEEYGEVKKHPENGVRILEPLIDDLLVLGVVRWHHERWDGGGYPDGLAGERIPLPARVLAVADTLDAMTSNRAYRMGLPWETAVTEVRNCSGTHFDPRVVAAMESALPELEKRFRTFAAEGTPSPRFNHPPPSGRTPGG